MMTSKAPSSFSSMNATATSSKRFSGLVSGLDTDTLVQQMSSRIQSKIDKQMQNKQIALWKQQSYRQVTSAVTEFKNKYFSSSSSTSNISNPSFFNATSIKNTSSFLNVSGNVDVAKNMVVTEIGQLAQQASFSSKHKVSNEMITTGVISSDWAKSKVSGSSMTINYGGKDYAVNLSSEFTFNSTDNATNIKALSTDLNTQISKIDGLKDIVKFGDDGKITLTGSANVTINDGSELLLKGLGLTKGSSYSATALSGDTDASSLFSTEKLVDSLSGSTLTFSINGVSKNIKFDESKKGEYSTPDGLKTYLQGKLDTAYGKDKVTVSTTATGTGDGSISFKTTDATSIVSIVSSDKSGILGMNGTLRTYAGETNRINTNKTLKDIQKNLDTRAAPDSYGALTKIGSTSEYGFKINGIDFKFKSTDTIANIISTVNNDTNANVTIAYSTINDSFSVTAKNGGASGKVEIENLDGSNLANHLFGSSGTDYTVNNGLNAVLKVSFDGNAANVTTIIRTENKFELDGVNFELLSKTDATVTADKPIKFSGDNKSDELFTKVKSFIEDYNALIELTNGKVSERKETGAAYAPLTDAQKKDMSEAQITAWETKAKKGILQGDSILNSLSLDLRNAMTDQVASTQSALFQIGIASKAFDYSANGKLIINDEKLKKALNDDSQKIASMFTGTDGIATRLQNVINQNIKTIGGNGTLIQKAGMDKSSAVDNSSISASIKDYDSKIKDLQTRMKIQQEQYYRKFTRLEQYLSKMNSQASMFTVNTPS